jgi:hypothetical protein
LSTFKIEGIHTSTGSCCYEINQVKRHNCELQFCYGFLNWKVTGCEKRCDEWNQVIMIVRDYL